ncbi:hypothetical protein [Cloacibacillus evryensis]|uniref:hypothetical protein n=1 Tax=Cloacibacillus evryensis TaxID=508460 RepID=UPI00210ECD95|nr:hypothetical protein [Cloacibacillus evryensis]MCQ4763252.1 hypothetical protein [Cloacibacillus evryensis]
MISLGDDTVLERKLSLYESLGRGLPQHLKLKLRILAVEEAQEDTRIDYSKALEVLRSALSYQQGGAIEIEGVSAVLTAIRNTEEIGEYAGGYLYINSERFTQLTEALRVSRLRVLRAMAGMGLLRLSSGDGPRFTYQRSVGGVKGRCVAIKWEVVADAGEA